MPDASIGVGRRGPATIACADTPGFRRALLTSLQAVGPDVAASRAAAWLGERGRHTRRRRTCARNRAASYSCNFRFARVRQTEARVDSVENYSRR
jgi:hypothetical protein